MSRKPLDSAIIAKGESFSKLLRQEREKKEMSQSDLARAANVGLDTIRSIENNRIASPGLFLAADLIHALGGNIERWIKEINEG